MKNLQGWFDSPIETAKAKYQQYIADWNNALQQLDTERYNFYSNPSAADDPDLSERYHSLDNKLSLLQSTIDGTNNAVSSVMDFIRGVGASVGLSGIQTVNGLGLAPIAVAGWVALILAGTAAVWALINELRAFNVDVTNKQIAQENIRRSQSGQSPLPLIDTRSTGPLAGISDTAKWISVGVIGYFLLKLISNERGH